MDGKQLDCTSAEQDLGITIETDVSIDNHVNETVNKENILTGIVVRHIQCKDKSIMVRLYKTFVRPILECGNVVWNTRLKTHITQIKLKLFKEDLLSALLASKAWIMKKVLGGYTYLVHTVDALDVT